MKKIAILDYGLGNVRSLLNSIKKINQNVYFYSENKKTDFDMMFIPGVGSYGKAMQLLENEKYIEIIKNAKNSGKLIIGICLGMQLLFEHGTESGLTKGLNYIKGSVNILDSNEKTKLPNIGSKKIYKNNTEKFSFLNKFNEQKFYFIHAYACLPENKDNILFYSSYNNKKFSAMVFENNVVGMQFHPEKSGQIGLELLESLIKNI